MSATHKVPDKESETVEFKSTFNMDCIETLVAFANHKGGSIYVGVNDDGKAAGVATGKETLTQWVNEIKGKTEPAIIPGVATIALEAGKSLIVLSVEEFPVKPVSVKGKYYKRTGASNHLLSLNDIVNMRIQTFNSSWDYDLDAHHHISDISEDKALRIIHLYNKSREFPIESNVLEFLTKMELLREGKLTYAAFLLLMKSDSVFSTIEMGRFQDEITIKDGVTVATDLITEVEEVLAFIRKHINKAFIITEKPAREERWDYPLDALREIVMNMIVHRDYSHYGESSIKIFNDRIEFFNPGRLPDGISEDDLRKGTYVSSCRNKLIARVFKEITWIERYGTGVRRVTSLFERYGCPKPLFENFQHGFKVTAYPLQSTMKEKLAEKGDDAVEKTTEKTTEKATGE
ncbi:MAG: putative DNA binding domain-containing protein, partial [Prevotellaceae bacterium]|nr:putative DNA binding domain-containing protein [Prevotellaceae bacterium]